MEYTAFGSGEDTSCVKKNNNNNGNRQKYNLLLIDRPFIKEQWTQCYLTMQKWNIESIVLFWALIILISHFFRRTLWLWVSGSIGAYKMIHLFLHCWWSSNAWGVCAFNENARTSFCCHFYCWRLNQSIHIFHISYEYFTSFRKDPLPISLFGWHWPSVKSDYRVILNT